jgi:hypothetical protein
MHDVLHSLLLFPQAYSKLQEGKCFLWPTAELHFALQAPRPSFSASSATALFLQVLVSNLEPPPDKRLVNLSLAYSPYRECCDMTLIFK